MSCKIRVSASRRPSRHSLHSSGDSPRSPGHSASGRIAQAEILRSSSMAKIAKTGDRKKMMDTPRARIARSAPSRRAL